MALLSVQDLVFRYDKEVVLDHVDLELGAGEIVTLLGPNGCGKTTLLDCIIGYRQYENGTVMIDGRDNSKYSVKEKAKHIAYVPQSMSNIFPYSVMQIVLMGRTPHLGATASPTKKDYDIAQEALDSMGIIRFKDRAFSQLSGGERQLVMIARSLAQDSKVILLDEPTSSLDIKNEAMVLSHIRDMVKRTHKSVLIATHQPNHTFYFSCREVGVNAALFADKKIKYFGHPEEVLNEMTINEVYNVSCGIYEYKENKKTIIVH